MYQKQCWTSKIRVSICVSKKLTGVFTKESNLTVIMFLTPKYFCSLSCNVCVTLNIVLMSRDKNVLHDVVSKNV